MHHLFSCLYQLLFTTRLAILTLLPPSVCPVAHSNHASGGQLPLLVFEPGQHVRRKRTHPILRREVVTVDGRHPVKEEASPQ